MEPNQQRNNPGFPPGQPQFNPFFSMPPFQAPFYPMPPMPFYPPMGYPAQPQGSPMSFQPPAPHNLHPHNYAMQPPAPHRNNQPHREQTYPIKQREQTYPIKQREQTYPIKQTYPIAQTFPKAQQPPSQHSQRTQQYPIPQSFGPPPTQHTQPIKKKQGGGKKRTSCCGKMDMTPSQFANHCKSHVTCAQCEFVGLRAVVTAHGKEKHAVVGGGQKRKVVVERGEDKEVDDYVAERKRKYRERILGNKATGDEVVKTGGDEDVTNVEGDAEEGEVEEGELVDDGTTPEDVQAVKAEIVHAIRTGKVSQPPSNFKKAKKGKEGSFLQQLLANQIDEEVTRLSDAIDILVSCQFLTV